MEDKKEILLTQEGYQKLEDELEILKTVRRREVADRIKVAYMLLRHLRKC